MSGGGGSDGGFSTGGATNLNSLVESGGSQAPVVPVQAASSGFTAPLISGSTDQGQGISGTPSPVETSTPSDTNLSLTSNASSPYGSLGSIDSLVQQPTSAGGVSSVSTNASTPAAAPGFSSVSTALGTNSAGTPSGTSAAGASGSGVGATDLSANSVGTDSITGQSVSLDQLTNVTGGGTKAADSTGTGTKASDSKGGFDWSKLLGPAVAAGGLGYSLYNQKTQSSGIPSTGDSASKVTTAADTLNKEGQQQVTDAASTYQTGQNLTNYLTSGTLPANMQSQLDRATSSAKTAIISNYASRGMSTDPNQNSVLAQELAQVDQNALTTKATMEQQLLQAGQTMVNTANSMVTSGMSGTNMSATLYNQLIALDQQLSANTGKAIANVASAIGTATSGTSKNVIQIGGTQTT